MSVIETAVALCAVGAEKIVSNEIKKFGLKVSEGGYGRIRFQADLRGLYRALMGLRAADRVLLETAWFEAADFDALFEGVRNIPWEDYIPPGFGLTVAKVRTNRSRLQAETSVQAVVHKAAAERLCSKRGINRLPDNGEAAELRVYIEKDMASILLDLSGEPLFKRGYRTRGGVAPLRETTAAAIILASLWKRKFPLYDPFCGSGTIAIEAAMYAWDIAPGLGRHFSLEKLLLGSRETEAAVRDEYVEKIDFSRLVRISASDSDAASVAAAGANIESALALVRGGGPRITPPAADSLPSFRVLPMEEAAPVTEEGFLITNPPYGRRMGDTESSEKIYTEMGKLARRFSGWKLALITDHPGFESFFGKKADSCREITNGAIRSYLYQYEKL
ncbi:MAG: class I SAM-dependent RNA methyltransferase [Treponema sp.]|jgi:putative N6-adenine-specific DNA methylase|nr:class I SAM-dependent RNA methyltransferase [Treponema sp.]